MISVLVVDDDSAKVAEIRALLREQHGLDGPHVAVVGDVVAAKRRLSSETFDLLLVDVVLPVRAGAEPAAEGGIGLIDEIFEGPPLKMPGHIVGITGFDDAFSVASQRFAPRTLSVLRYERGEAIWKEYLSARVNQIVASKTATEQPSYRAALGVVCALQSPELDAVKRLPWNWSSEAVPNDPALYWRGYWETAQGRADVFAVAAPRIGLPAAAVAASKLIAQFRPRYIAMPGICAGVRERTRMGQVIVADPVWDYGSGKWVREGRKVKFLHAPQQLALNATVRAAVQRLGTDVATLAVIRAGWPGERPDGELSVHVGPFASGAAVIADGERIASIGEQHRNLLGIDMEAYAVHLAADEAAEPRPLPLVIKTVVDHADEHKGDAHQRYGAHVSAQILRILAETLVSG
jgi:nucleoside phosphorylase/CheY-like chemotaxis protein